MKTNSTALAAILVCIFGIGISTAENLQPCRMGTLIDLTTRRETVAGPTNGHYEEKVKKDGRKVIDGYDYGGDQIKVTYVLTVSSGDLVYTAENPQNIFFGYNPTDLVVNDPISICVEKQKLIFIRPNGKQYKTRIVRMERNPMSVISPKSQQ